MIRRLEATPHSSGNTEGQIETRMRTDLSNELDDVGDARVDCQSKARYGHTVIRQAQ